MSDAEMPSANPTEQPTATEVITDPSNPAVLEKYKLASSIAQSALAAVVADIKPEAKVFDLAAKGDSVIREQTSKFLNKDKKLEKGVAFPTSVAVNSIVGNCSPSSVANNTTTLQAGDVVKIDLSVHIDGYIAAVAQTVVVQPLTTDAEKLKKVADLMHALNTAGEAVMRVMRPGNKNTAVTDIIARVATTFGVTPVQGVLSHSMDRFVLDGPKVILNRGGEFDREARVEEFEFQPNQVIAFDLVLSTGDGKPRQHEDATTIYKRIPDSKYALKLSASREVFSDIVKQAPVFPFTLRTFDSAKAKIAMKECLQHGLFNAYPVLTEKAGEIVAQSKFTVLITEQGAVKLTAPAIDLKGLSTEVKVADEEIKKLLAAPVLIKNDADAAAKAKKNAAKRAAKAKKAAAGGSAAMEQ